jgi:NADH-quinone oxidoreductase subunit H
VTFALFLLWFATALADSKRSGSRLAEADLPAEGGRPERRGGLGFLFFFFAEWANLFVMSCLGAALFLGGWQIPGVDPLAVEAKFGLECVGAAIFQCKSWGLVLLVAWVRRAVPRVQVDRMMSICWKWLVPSSLVGLLLTAGWIFWNPLPLVQRFVAFGTFALWLLLLGSFAYRMVQHSRTLSTPAHLNPFL